MEGEVAMLGTWREGACKRAAEAGEKEREERERESRGETERRGGKAVEIRERKTEFVLLLPAPSCLPKAVCGHPARSIPAILVTLIAPTSHLLLRLLLIIISWRV